MSDEDRKDNPGFVVKDRRRFDESGNEKAGEAEPAPAPKESKPMPKNDQPQLAETPPSQPGHQEVEIDFSSFVMSLATQALMQLGEIKPPPGVEIEVDAIAAKQTIDILGMLEIKTRGNLENDEKNLLDEILRNLRLSFVRASK